MADRDSRPAGKHFSAPPSATPGGNRDQPRPNRDQLLIHYVDFCEGPAAESQLRCGLSNYSNTSSPRRTGVHAVCKELQ
jgi:hypothetical protein